jgi:hypothetical protein
MPVETQYRQAERRIRLEAEGRFRPEADIKLFQFWPGIILDGVCWTCVLAAGTGMLRGWRNQVFPPALHLHILHRCCDVLQDAPRAFLPQ